MSDNSQNVLVTKSKVVLTVNDFDVTTDSVYCSKDFRIGSNVFEIILYTNFTHRYYSEPVFIIGIRLKSKDNLFVRIDLIIYESNMKNKCYTFGDFQELSNDLITGIASINKRQFAKEKDRLFADRRLIIGLIISVESKDVFETIQTNISHRNTFNVKELSDFHISFGDKEFFVSRAVLSSHSQVFEKMFANEMRDQNSNQLLIEGIDGEVFEEFLKFIYFGNSDKLEELSEELLIIADKFQVLDLKIICKSLMFIEMCDTNAIKLLLTFVKYNCNQMTEYSIEFIANHLFEIKTKTPIEWKELTERHNHLLIRITEKMSEINSELIQNGVIGDKRPKDSIKAFTFSYIK